MNGRTGLALKDIHTKKQLQIEKRLAEAKLAFDLSWWVKWAASLILLAAMALRGAQVLPVVDLCLSFIGVVGWLWVAVLWKDRALIMLNTAASIILGIGILRVFAGV